MLIFFGGLERRTVRFNDSGIWAGLTSGGGRLGATGAGRTPLWGAIYRAGTITGTGAVTIQDLMRATGTLDLGAALNRDVRESRPAHVRRSSAAR